jgi:hypothetical protein
MTMGILRGRVGRIDFFTSILPCTWDFESVLYEMVVRDKDMVSSPIGVLAWRRVRQDGPGLQHLLDFLSSAAPVHNQWIDTPAHVAELKVHNTSSPDSEFTNR